MNEEINKALARRKGIQIKSGHFILIEFTIF